MHNVNEKTLGIVYKTWQIKTLKIKKSASFAFKIVKALTFFKWSLSYLKLSTSLK